MNTECETIRPRLFEIVEDERTADERAEIAAHLATCEACRRELLEERALTELLRRPRTAHDVKPLPRLRWLRHVAAVLLVAGALLVVDALMGGTPAYGSNTPSTLNLSMTFEEGPSAPLRSHNHLEVPLDSVHFLNLLGTGTIRVAGPAVLDLDRTADGWKVTLLRGRIHAELEEDADMIVTSVFGERMLGGGAHVLSLEPSSFSPDARGSDGPSPAELFNLGLDEFFDRENMAAAEAYFRAVLEREELDRDLQSQTLFFLAASLGRQEDFTNALEVQEEWFRLDADREARHYVLFFHGLYHEYLGNRDEAWKCWNTIRDEDPESELLESIPLEQDPAAPSGSSAASARGDGSYVVVTLGLREDDSNHGRFARVAAEVAAYHEAERIDCIPDELKRLETALHDLAPENVLVVVPPDLLDVNLHRRLLLLSAGLDEDPLPDFAFGYFTHRTGEGLEEMWRRTRRLHEEGFANRTWVSTFVTSGMKSTVWASYVDDLTRAAGFSGPGIGFAIVEDDPAVRDFVAENLGRLESASVVQLTGNGDPQGIWLFDDSRNVDSSKHWSYRPELVGHDPGGAMPRVLAREFAALELASPIVWSGTCHSAATGRVFVEGDIVSTFGVTDRVTVHELAPEESLCLAILDAGAVAFLAPIAANHGFSVDLESEFALREGASLGEAIKSTWDDVFLAAGGELVLDLVEPGRPHSSAEYVMQGGGANRILIGDPSLRPFSAAAHPRERTVIVRHEDGFDVGLEWDEGFHFREWDIYGTSADDWRIGERVALEGLLPEGAELEVTVEVRDGDGELLPYELTRAEFETYHGRRYLHLQANADRELTRGMAKHAVFRVRFAGHGETR